MDGIAWAGSAMVAARTRLDIATENLANVSSGSFRGYVARGRLTAHGVTIARRIATRQGGLTRTGRALDFAIVGPGAFRVRSGDGRIERTRDGALTRAADGTLRDRRDRVVLGARGPLHLPPGARIAHDGRVRLAGRTLDRIALPLGSSLHAGFLERANVDAIRQMVDVLAAERSFESAQKVVSAIDAVRGTAAQSARVK